MAENAPGQEKVPITQTDVKLERLDANMTNMNENMKDLKLKMEKHIEISESRGRSYEIGNEKLVEKMTQIVQEKFDAVVKMINDHKDDQEKKMSYMRKEIDGELEKKVPYKDFKTVMAVVSAVALLVGFGITIRQLAQR